MKPTVDKEKNNLIAWLVLIIIILLLFIFGTGIEAIGNLIL